MEDSVKDIQERLEYQQGEIVALLGAVRHLLVNLPEFVREETFSSLKSAIQTGEDMEKVRARVLGAQARVGSDQFIKGLTEMLQHLTIKVDS